MSSLRNLYPKSPTIRLLAALGPLRPVAGKAKLGFYAVLQKPTPENERPEPKQNFFPLPSLAKVRILRNVGNKALVVQSRA